MKILVVSNMFPDRKHPSYGVFVKNYCEQLDKLKIEYDLAVMKKADSLIGKVKNYILFYMISFFKALVGKYDTIYIHYASHSSAAILLANRIRSLRIFTNVHGSDVIPENKKQEKMQHYTSDILKQSERVIVPSEYFKSVVVQKYKIDENKVFVSPSGGVDESVFYDNGKHQVTDTLKIGYVGRISYKKGWDVLIKACSKLNFDYKLLVVGDGPDKEKMAALAKQFGVDGHIEWSGFLSQNELREVYNQMDVFVFPTEREGESLGLVAVEAMACGTPVIASDYAAPGRYIVDNYNGFKFGVGNDSELSDKLKSFYLLTEDEKKILIVGAKETAKTFSKDVALKTMNSILRSKDA